MTSVAMSCSRAKAMPPASGRLLITAATCASCFLRQLSRWAARTIAAMFEPPPEIRITMFFIESELTQHERPHPDRSARARHADGKGAHRARQLPDVAQWRGDGLQPEVQPRPGEGSE